MKTEFYAFGEILWDCLPSGRHAGGAPFNVTAHLVQLGVSASILSAVGQDLLGDEILEVARDKGVNVEFVSRARVGLPTGTVIATVDAMGNATYELVQPVAWDEITFSAEALEAVSKAGAFIFGSLATRSPCNLEQLDRLLAVQGPLKFFDVVPRLQIRSVSSNWRPVRMSSSSTMTKSARSHRGCEPVKRRPIRLLTRMPSRKLAQRSPRRQRRLASVSRWLPPVRRCGTEAL